MAAIDKSHALRLRNASKRLETARTARDEAIRVASSAGASRRAVAAAVGLTPGRVQQILDAPQQSRDRARHARPGS